MKSDAAVASPVSVDAAARSSCCDGRVEAPSPPPAASRGGRGGGARTLGAVAVERALAAAGRQVTAAAVLTAAALAVGAVALAAVQRHAAGTGGDDAAVFYDRELEGVSGSSASGSSAGGGSGSGVLRPVTGPTADTVVSGTGNGAAAAAVPSSSHAPPSPHDWCLPSEITVDFEGVWRGLVLWGALPVDGPVAGTASIAQSATDTLVHFAYTIGGAPGVVQEQWALWHDGGRAITIGRNTTTAMGAGSGGAAGAGSGGGLRGLLRRVPRLVRSLASHATGGGGGGGGGGDAAQSTVVSSCTLIEDEPATSDNNPAFCARTADIDLRFTRRVGMGGGGVAAAAGGGGGAAGAPTDAGGTAGSSQPLPPLLPDLEEYDFDKPRVENATLRLLMARLPLPEGGAGPHTAGGAAHRPSFRAVPGHSLVLPVWHWFGAGGPEYMVHHVMTNPRPWVDHRLYAAMPDPATCTPAREGADTPAGTGAAADVAARAAAQAGRRGSGAASGIHAVRRRHANTPVAGAGGGGGGGSGSGGGRCPFAHAGAGHPAVVDEGGHAQAPLQQQHQEHHQEAAAGGGDAAGATAVGGLAGAWCAFTSLGCPPPATPAGGEAAGDSGGTGATADCSA